MTEQDITCSEAPPETDEQLMRRVQADDTGAFSALFDRHHARALGVAGVICGDRGRTEDAVQEGFVTIWRSRATFRASRGSFRAWAMTIVRHRAVDSVRVERSGSRPPVAMDDSRGDLQAPGSVEQDAIARDDAQSLQAALAQLPAAQAEVIVLAFYGQLSHAEISTELGLPSGTVKGRMRLGLDKLRESKGAADAAGSGD